MGKSVDLAGSPTIVDCGFFGNTADFAGGAAYNQDSTARFIHCVFEVNRANNRGGAIYNTFSSQTLVNRCMFAGNHADSGGAIHSSGCEPIVANSVFSGNSALAGGALFNNGGGTVDDDLRLRSGSTSINAGDNEAVPDGFDIDLAGGPRIAGGRVDLGAYELAPGSGADLDGDGDVDRDDLAFFETCQTGPAMGPPSPSSCSVADLDGDADVDQTDFGVFQRAVQAP